MAVVKLPKPERALNGQIATETENGKLVWWRDEQGVHRCGAHPNSEHGPCRNPHKRLGANGRCFRHGKSSPGAPLKHGRTSKFFNRLNLGEDYEAEIAREDISSHRENIGVFEVLIQQQLDKGICPSADEWNEARAVYALAIKSKEPQQRLDALVSLGKILDDGAEHAKNLEKVLDLIDRQGRHKASEERREKGIRDTVMQKMTQLILLRIAQTLKEETNDLDLVKRVGERLILAVGQTTRDFTG